MLHRDNQTMSLDQFFVRRTRQVHSRSSSDHRRFRQGIVFAVAERTCGEGFLSLFVVVDGELTLHGVRTHLLTPELFGVVVDVVQVVLYAVID